MGFRQAIGRGLANSSRTVRLPVHIASQARKIADRERTLGAELGRDPTDEELAASLEMEMEEIIAIRAADQSPTSLDRRVGDSEDTALGDLIADKAPGIEEDVVRNEDERTVLRLVGGLPSPDRDVLKLRYGLGGTETVALKETGRWPRAWTPASVRPATLNCTPRARTVPIASSSSSWTVRRPGCRAQPENAVPS